MNSKPQGNKIELPSGKTLSILVIVILTLPLVISIYREWGFYVELGGQGSISEYLKSRYSTPLMIAVDIICAAAVAAVCYIILKINHRINTSHMFVKMATAANAPVFLINEKQDLLWTNIGQINRFNDCGAHETVDTILKNATSQNMIAKCLSSTEATNYELETKIGNTKYWLHITLTILSSPNSSRMICATISDISNMKEANEKIENQQRELQMQTEMLSLITAQMEVQQAGVSEQNDILQQQSHKLEEQAMQLNKAFRELEERSKLIVMKTNYITDSIKYAQTIQEAILPDQEQLSDFFDNFIIYWPKDIVSGDFYWLSKRSNYIYIVLGDCTGHGVPGAFMSMIGIRILGELINEQNVKEPSAILKTMHSMIKQALKQDTTENNDGMDIAVCRLERVRHCNYDWELVFAGAKQPVYIVRKNSGKEDAEKIEANRRGVGGQTIMGDFEFEEKTIELQNGDRIYLTSDGIQDQNNIMRKRFGSARLRMVLSATQTENIKDQENNLKNILRNWQGLEDQRDDISLWAIELSDKVTTSI